MRGPWLAQHDPDILANGNILLFDNLGNFLEADGSDAEAGGGRSRVLEFDPSTMAIAWQYAGTGRGAVRERCAGIAGAPFRTATR